jgi:hypothetical protein
LNDSAQSPSIPKQGSHWAITGLIINIENILYSVFIRI